MKILLVADFDVPTPEDIPQIIDALDPPRLPFFGGKLRVVPEPDAVEAVIDYLDDDHGFMRLRTLDDNVSPLSRIANEEVTINGVSTTYGAIDEHAHACIHDDDATGLEKGMATALLKLLDDLDDARERISEMGS